MLEQASSKPLAQVAISNPAVHPLQSQDEQLAFPFLPGAQALYVPLPLFDDETVERNYSRNILAAAQLTSRTPVSQLLDDMS